MRIRFSLELRISPEPKTEPEVKGPEGAESMIIHQDQPRYTGFLAEEPHAE